MIGRHFSLAHDRWINLSHRQKLASRKRDFSGVAENSSDRELAKKGEAEHQTCWISSNARVDTHSPCSQQFGTSLAVTVFSLFQKEISYSVPHSTTTCSHLLHEELRQERPYHSDSTASRLLSEVKHCRAQLVLRWGTTLESWVLFFCTYYCSNGSLRLFCMTMV